MNADNLVVSGYILSDHTHTIILLIASKSFRFIAIALWVTAFSSVLAPRIYPGKITTSSGDTLDGFIDYRNWRKNPTEIVFRHQEGATLQNYTSFDIRAFKVQNRMNIS